METLRSGCEFDHPFRSENLEDTAAIGTVICQFEFLTQLVQGEDISNAPGIEVDGCMSKIGLLGSLESPLVAVDADRSSGWMDVVDVFRLREEMDRGLTVK